MNATELRIGNCIHHQRIGVICKFVNHRVISDIASNPNNHAYTPIKLIEEWFFRLGFEKKDIIWHDKSVTKNAYKKGKYFIEITREGILFCEENYDGSHYIAIIEYVHQLQNLYFALKQTELKIDTKNISYSN